MTEHSKGDRARRARDLFLTETYDTSLLIEDFLAMVEEENEGDE